MMMVLAIYPVFSNLLCENLKEMLRNPRKRKVLAKKLNRIL